MIHDYRGVRVLLLLSGGKDSRLALERLIEAGAVVSALCIDGQQGEEAKGALAASREFSVPLRTVSLRYFDETTWNPFKLIVRDLGMAYVAVKTAREQGARVIATGVKKSDVDNPRLWWLGGFLRLMSGSAQLFGLKLVFPVWELTNEQRL